MICDANSVTSMGQASAALSAAAGEDLASVGGPHSLAEAVLLGALTLLRLIGPTTSETITSERSYLSQ